jgi:hypothetical protein
MMKRTAKSKLEELQELVNGRENALREATKDVNDLSWQIEQQQKLYSQAVVEGDVSQGSKLKNLHELKQKYQDALIRLEALQNANKEARQSEKLDKLCQEVEEEAKAEIARLATEKDKIRAKVEEIARELIETGMPFFDLQKQQEEIYSKTLHAIKQVRGKKHNLSLPGPGIFTRDGIPFGAVIADTWKMTNEPRRRPRPVRYNREASRLLNM